MPGFWESLQGNLSGVFDDYEKMKQEKRLRALQKMKFIMDSGDVGTQVDPETQEEITDYAPEAASFIKDGAYTGSAEQQRAKQFRDMIASNPDMAYEDILTQGAASGAVTGNALSNYFNGVESRKQSAELARERMQNQQTMQEDRQAHTLLLRGIIEAGMRDRSGGGDTGDLFENKTARQKWAANRKTYLPYGGPYDYFTKHLLNNPESARSELAQTLQSDDIDIGKPEPWEQYANHIQQNILNQRDTYGMKPEEINALINHIQGIASKRR